MIGQRMKLWRLISFQEWRYRNISHSFWHVYVSSCLYINASREQHVPWLLLNQSYASGHEIQVHAEFEQARQRRDRICVKFVSSWRNNPGRPKSSDTYGCTRNRRSYWTMPPPFKHGCERMGRAGNRTFIVKIFEVRQKHIWWIFFIHLRGT